MTAIANDAPHVPATVLELSGTVLEQRYELGRVLGSGGMGAVFEARHLRLDRPVAIKVLQPSFAADGRYIERFLREAKAASSIRHRNVVEVLDYGETSGGLVYSVMEFLVGQDLQHLLEAQPHGRLPWSQVCGLLVQIASGLKAAHGKGVIHRDIKPANCFLTEEDGEPVVKVVDFGIAKLDGGDQEQALTGAAQVLGTPSYIAPEMLRTQKPASPQSDVYALGVMTYRMLTGRVPFEGETIFEQFRRACFDPVPSLREQVPEISPAVEAFVVEMLAKDPERRPPSMKAVRERLVALSRETLGMQTMELPGSGGLLLSTDDGMPTPEALDGVGLLRRPGETVVTKPMLEPGGAPRRSMGSDRLTHELISASWSSPAASRSGETVSALGETTLRGVEASGAIEPLRRRGGLKLALGSVGALVVAGALTVAGAPTAEGTRVAEAPAVPTVASDEVIEPVAAMAAVEPKPNATEDEPEPELEPELENENENENEGALVDESAEAAEPDARAVPSPAPEPRSKRSKANATAKPPADAVQLRRLERKIAKQCAAALASGSVTVKFLVTASGELMGLTATGPAGSCARAQVDGTRFRERDKSAPFKITVE